jgi:hypothetical protein
MEKANVGARRIDPALFCSCNQCLSHVSIALVSYLFELMALVKIRFLGSPALRGNGFDLDFQILDDLSHFHQ